MRFVEAAWLVARKDLLIEVRSREIVYTTLFFAVSCVLVFAFGFVREGRAVEDAAAGILWVAIAFSGTLALGRAFERERQNETLRGLLMAPIPRAALYVGKLAGIVLLLMAVEAGHRADGRRDVPGADAGAPADARGPRAHRDDRLRRGRHAVRRHARPHAQPRRAAAGAAVSDDRPGDHRRRPRHRRAARRRADVAMARLWLSMLVYFDVVFITLALWTFEAVMTE